MAHRRRGAAAFALLALVCVTGGCSSCSPESDLAAIATRVRDLTSGHKVLVVLLDYWSVWLGGKYAAANGEEYVDAEARVTDEVDDVIKSTADRSGSAYVDLRAAFKGPDHAYDESHYLSSDGDHPDAAGQQKIADATEAVIENTLHIEANRDGVLARDDLASSLLSTDAIVAGCT